MTADRLVAEPRADLDIAATIEWYEEERAGLGQEFLDELRATYDRLADAPLQYQQLGQESGALFCAASPMRCTSSSGVMWSWSSQCFM